jgi:hypothetical protein
VRRGLTVLAQVLGLEQGALGLRRRHSSLLLLFQAFPRTPLLDFLGLLFVKPRQLVARLAVGAGEEASSPSSETAS